MSERPIAIGLFREAVLRFGEGQTATASRLADRSRELFLLAGDVDGACAAALLRGRAALRAARYPEAAHWLQWARDEAFRRGLVPRVLSASSELAVLAELQGDLLGAVAAHRDVLDQQRQRDDNLGIAMAAGNVARLLPRVAGHTPQIVGEARELLADALQRFRDGPHDAGIANSLICIGDLDRADGKLDDAQRLFQEVIEMTPTSGVQPMRLLAMHNQGSVLRQMGDYLPAIAAYEAAHALAVALGEVRSARRARTALLMTEAMSGPLDKSLTALVAMGGDLVGSDEDVAKAVLWMNESHLYAASGQMDVAMWCLKDAHRIFKQRADRVMLDEADLAIAAIALMTSSDRRAQKQTRRRKSQSVNANRERQLLRAQVAFRRLDLRDFDETVEALGTAKSWQEAVGIGALCVERAALAGVDNTAGLDPMAELALERGARVDYLTLRLAQANAALWLGNLQQAEAWSAEVATEAAVLGRPFLDLGARLVYGAASGNAIDAASWQKEATRWREFTAIVPAAWCDALASIETLDDGLFEEQIKTLHEAGDERSKLFFFALRAARGPRDIVVLAVQNFTGAGIFVPPWLTALLEHLH